MDTGKRLDALACLDRFFEEIRDEARGNPAFAARLVKALGGEIVFDAADRRHLLNPIAMALSGDEARFRAEFAAMVAADLRAVLRDFNLASAVDMRGRDKAELVDMLWQRALAKGQERASPGDS